MIYIIKTKTAFLFYYCTEGRLVKRIKSAEGLSQEYTIIENVNKDFSLSLAPAGTIYIFALNKSGITLITETKQGFSKKLILKNIKSASSMPVFFDAKQYKNNINLIYNTPWDNSCTNSIYLHRLSKNQSPPIFADTSQNVQNLPFTVCHIPDLRILFYQKRASQNKLVYREVSQTAIGSCHTVFSSSAPFSDYSVLVVPTGLYFLAATNNIFFSRLIFKQRTGDELSPLRNVANMPSIACPMLFFNSGKINMFFTSAGRPYISVDFAPPKPYNGKISHRLAKARFIDNTASNIIASEALVNCLAPWEIQLYPQIDADFENLTPPSPPKPPLESGKAVKIKRGEYSFNDFFPPKGGAAP